MKKNYSAREKLVHYARLIHKRAAQGQLPASRQLLEMLILWLWRGQGPGYYQMAGFWRREIPWGDKIAHMNSREYRAAVNRLNPPAYHKLSQNKLAEKGIMALFGIAGTEYLGYLEHSVGVDSHGERLRSTEELERLLRAFPGDAICFKPVESWAGQGFLSLEIQDFRRSGSLRPMHGGEPLTAGELYEQLGIGRGRGFIIESYFRQHDWYARLNPSSVNTFRLWVVADRGAAETRVGYLRIGRAGSMVDNQSAGGIVAPLDLESGRLGPALDGLPGRETWTAHPDTGTPIAGESPPFLDESKALAEHCLDCFPGLRFAGVDVAVGPDGPVIIEMNVSPDREGAAFADRPTKQVFSG
ncbi:MAG TPA: hypothetical protein ENK50_09145 [Sedimenticola sp.]|nr:hypothetical protein [Sedimenticola sp.]